jgi:hypothetical protein
MADRDDAELLARLGRALSADPVEPSPVELARLHLALAGPDRRPRPSRVPLWRRPLPVMLSFAVGIGGIAAGAAGAGAGLPAPLRSVAVAVGLPVEDGATAAARTDMARLRSAMARRDRAGIESAAVLLRRCLDRLSEDERARVEPEADQLLVAADTLLPTLPPPGPGNNPVAADVPTVPATTAPAQAPRSTTTVAPTTSTTARESGDEHGSGETTSVAPTTTSPSSDGGGGTDGGSGSGSDGGSGSSTDGGSGSSDGGSSSGG